MFYSLQVLKTVDGAPAGSRRVVVVVVVIAVVVVVGVLAVYQDVIRGAW